MKKLQIVVAFTAVLAVSCARSHGQPEPRAKLSRKQFVDVMVALERAQPADRDAVLKKQRVTEADLRDFVQKYSTTPEYLSMAFDSIQSAVDRAQLGTK